MTQPQEEARAGAPQRLQKIIAAAGLTSRRKAEELITEGRVKVNGQVVTELGAKEAYVYAMGEEDWLGHVMATTYTEDTYQIKQIDEFLTWCKDHDITAGHLFKQQEWRW